MVKMEEVTYEMFLSAINKIADQIKDLDINSLYGVPRGGMVVAVYLSHATGLPVQEEWFDVNEKCLICDDIADTGETLLPYKFNGFKIATIYYHKQSKVVPDIWIYEKKDEWIKFPWETNASTKNHQSVE